MVLLLHILVAMSSLAWTGFTLFAPSKKRLNVSYALVVLTIATGSYLVWTLNAPMIQACTTGLVYLGIAFSGIAVARYRLTQQGLK